MIGLALRIFGSLGWILDRAGVDRVAFRAILEVKLLQDQRRTISGFQQTRPKSPQGAFLVSLITFAFMGVFAGMSLILFDSLLLGLTVVNSMFMMLMGLMLIADFTNVLVDTADNTILLPRPVSDRTLLAARTAHIVHYLGLLSLAFNAGTLVTGTILCGILFLPVHLLTMALSLLFVIFLVYIFYFLAMKKTDLERFRDIILYFQIAMWVMFFGGYQLMPRLVNTSVLENVSIEQIWWIYLYPPAWMAAPGDMLMGNTGPTQVLLTTLAVAVPLACFVLVIRYLAPGFTRALAAMDSSAAGREKRKSDEEIGSLARFGSRYFTRKGEERAAFEMLWSIASRDRVFKLATYPSVGFIIIMMVVMLFQDPDGPGGPMYLFMLYFGCYAGPTALFAMRMSDQFEAGWIYRALPIERPGNILLGGFKVAMLRFSIPVFLLIGCILAALRGPSVLIDVALAGAAMVLVSVLFVTLMPPRLPFSLPRSAQSSGQGAAIFGFLIILFFFGLGHYLLGFVPLAKPPVTIALGALAYLRTRACGRTTWARIQWSEATG